MTQAEMRGVPPGDIIVLTPNVWTELFWKATAERRLIVPRCTACATFRFPPTPFCWKCRAQTVDWIEHDGNGEIYSFTVIRHAVIPQVKEALPLIAAVVELPGTNGCRLVGSVVDCEPEDVSIGSGVSLDWYEVREDTVIPVFRLT